MIKKFIWEPWENPLLEDNINSVTGDEDNDDEYHDGYEGREQNRGFSILPIGPMKMMQTPFGIMPAAGGEDMLAQKFDLWVLHTNFDITEEIVQIVECVPGVETLDVMTRYRLRIGFPKVGKNISALFDVDKTKGKIEQILLSLFTYAQDELLDYISDPTIHRKAKEFRDHLLNKYDYWAMYVLPNGSIELIIDDSGNKEFNKMVKLFCEAQGLAGGIVLISDDRVI